MNNNIISFYDPKDSYYEFSNFYKHKLDIHGFLWSCVEHYFQAAKFYIPTSDRHMEYFNIIQQADSPTKIFMLGRQKKKGGYASKWIVNKKTNTNKVNDIIDKYDTLKIRDDWDDIKLNIMKEALIAKFTQNQKLKTLLLNTNNASIIEDSPRDSYWGIGKDKNGENMLGKLLMEVREELC